MGIPQIDSITGKLTIIKKDLSSTGGVGSHDELKKLGWLESGHSGNTDQIAYFNSTGGTAFLDPNTDNIINESIISGNTTTEALNNLVATINLLATHPTYIQPSSSITNVSNNYEIGSTQTINITQTFTQNDAGSKQSETIIKNSLTVSSGSTFNENLLIINGNIIYGGTVSYSSGPIKNNNIGVPDTFGRILSGTTTSANRTISGIYPIYYYKSSSPITSASMKTAIETGLATKLVIVSTGTITVPYAPNGEYFAVAYPATSTTKTKWYVTALSNGLIPGGVFGAYNLENINSFNSYWSNISYKIHTTPLLTNPTATQIELRNT